MNIDELKPAAYWLGGLTVHAALALGVYYGISLERPEDVLADASRQCDKWINEYLRNAAGRKLSGPCVKSLLCGAIARRRAGASRDPAWSEVLSQLESSRQLYKLAGDAQAFVGANWSRICLVAGSLQIDKAISQIALRRMLGFPEAQTGVAVSLFSEAA